MRGIVHQSHKLSKLLGSLVNKILLKIYIKTLSKPLLQLAKLEPCNFSLGTLETNSEGFLRNDEKAGEVESKLEEVGSFFTTLESIL